MPARFNHIALYVADLQRSVTFYCDVINAEIIPDPFRDDRHVWLRIGEHGQLHLIAGGAKPNAGNMHFSFSVPSLDDFAAHLRFSGIQYDDGHGTSGKTRLRPDGVKQIYFQDPDGYLIEANDDRF